MDIVPSIQLQTPCSDEENGDNFVSEGIAFQEDAQIGKRPRRTDFVCAAAISTPPGHRKISSERQMKEGFGLSSPKMKAKRRTAEIIEVHGGRIIRSTGRKDRHSKVCTARGTRDRRVRLSPKTAILFYDVQDKLGYDRPSKAIDWLMKEAKASIDALDEAQPAAANVTEIHGLPNSKNHQTLRTGHGLIQNFEHFNENNPISSFGLVTEGPAPLSSTEFPAYTSDEFNASVSRSEARQDYQVQFLSAPPLTTPSDIFGTNIETAKLQRNFSWNYANVRGAGEDYSSVSALPLHFPALADLGHSLQREPLQSSYSRIPNYSPQFSGFSNEELLNFTAAATSKEDAMDY